MFRESLSSITVFSLISLSSFSSKAFSGEISFNRDIRPILSSKCFFCHGPSEKSRKAKLRLDLEEDAFREKDEIAAFVRNNLEDSEAWHRISSDDPDEVMPPPEFKKELTKEEINLDIRIRHKGSKFDLIEDLKNSKLMLNPGHKGEVFCLVAEEARTMCLPIVTMGIGSLHERVIDNVTGYICSDLDQLISKSVSILKDDKLYLTLKSNLYEKRKTRTYKEVAYDFLKILNINEKN